jgi:hypothetical protein
MATVSNSVSDGWPIRDMADDAGGIQCQILSSPMNLQSHFRPSHHSMQICGSNDSHRRSETTQRLFRAHWQQLLRQAALRLVRLA